MAVCTIVDKGPCSCEFMRCTVNQMPAYPSTANTTHVPIAAICQPFAELTSHEESVPLVDLGESGPFRCTRCRAYANPNFTWCSGGREAVCNFCGQRIDVPTEYYSALDDRGYRRDQNNRPELQRGTVDYVAPSDYTDVLPGVPVQLFVVDASRQSVASGFFHQILVTLRSLIAFMQAPMSKIGLMTFNHALQFYAFCPGSEEARLITVSDIEEPFVPCGHDRLYADVAEEAQRTQFEDLLDRLPELASEGEGDQVAGCAALQAAVELVGMAGGGNVLAFHAALPSTGRGALRNRDDIRLYGTSEGVPLFVPQQAAFFNTLAVDCIQQGVAVNSWMAPGQGVYIDTASLTTLPRRTGGETFFLPSYDPLRDGEKLHYDICRTAMAGSAHSCIFKLRCSKGLSVDTMYAPWEPEVVDCSTFQVSRMSPDASVTFVITHSERIEGQRSACFQAACIYTDRSGQRLIRVHSLPIPVTTSLSNVFRYTEIDAVTNLLLKQAALGGLKGDNCFKEKLTKCCVDMLHAYRINCASATAAGQLILPESLKLLPLYIGSIRKMAAFRVGSDIRMDERVARLARLAALPIALTGLTVYPRIYPVWPMSETAGRSTGVGDNVHLPQTVACSHDRLSSESVYVVDNGASLQIYTCSNVSTEVYEKLFGVQTAAEVPAALLRLGEPSSQQAEASEDSRRLGAIVRQLRADKYRLPRMPLHAVFPGTPEESRLLSIFAEDSMAGEMLYVDFLCHVHKLVQNKLE